MDREKLTDWEFIRGDVGGIWEVWREQRGRAEQCLDWAWQKVTVPHCYTGTSAVAPDRPYYQGPAWYRTTLDVRDWEEGESLQLQFAGAGQGCQVYVDLEMIASHDNPYDVWTVDVTLPVRQWIAAGGEAERVPLAVRCDNSRNLNGIPSDLSDFVRHGGIYRPVTLRRRPALHLEDVQIRSTLTDEGTGTVSLKLTGSEKKDLPVKISLIDHEGRPLIEQTCQVFGTASCELEPLPHVEKWHVNNPKRYKLIFESAGERLERSIGFRQCYFEPKGPFYLNGERLLLRGTHRHEDHGDCGNAMDDKLIRREMEQIKAMGTNFIRLGHYQQYDLVLDLCDELGILVWEEIHWCRGGVGDESYRARCHQALESMIRRHSHHPSLMVWGLGNENDWPGDQTDFDEDGIRSLMQELHNRAKELDPARPTAIRRCAFCRDIVDVYSPSIWAGWYRGTYAAYRESTEKEIDLVNSMLHVEWGGDSHAGRFSQDPYVGISGVTDGNGSDERAGDYLNFGGDPRVHRDGDWSESYICDLMDWHLSEQTRMPRLTGTAQWVYKDFATPLRPNNPIPYVNQKGLVQRDLTPKSAYYVFQSYWADAPMVHILGQDWKIRDGKPDRPQTIRVYSNCPRVELIVDGIGRGIKRRNPDDFPSCGLRWELELEEGEHQVEAVGLPETGEPVRDALDFRLHLQGWGTPTAFRLCELSRDEETVTLEAQLVDEQDRPVLDDARFIRWTACGALELWADRGTAKGSSRIQLANGRTQIVSRRLGRGAASLGIRCEEGLVEAAVITVKL
ncbi:MAG: glycoside hydrolase family 2 TIM barrel-domain containing protein [Spirochaetales bacterium]|nr:glycoside hydrolase family 2 TIM barrel-domain containing protein [Spirochaetales bacterium]